MKRAGEAINAKLGSCYGCSIKFVDNNKLDDHQGIDVELSLEKSLDLWFGTYHA